MLRISLAAIVFAALTTACSSSSSDSTSAPTISAFALDSSDVEVGKASALSGSLDFADADGDVSNLLVDARAPGQSTSTRLATTKLTNTAGHTTGTLNVSLSFVAPAAGDYPFEIYVDDAQGHTSNHLTGTIHAK